MTDILDDLSSPSWWLSAFFMGLVTSLIGAYVKPRLDAALGKVSSRWRSRTEALRQAEGALVGAMVRDERKMRSAYTWMLYAYQRATFWLVCAALTSVCFFGVNKPTPTTAETVLRWVFVGLTWYCMVTVVASQRTMLKMRTAIDAAEDVLFLSEAENSAHDPRPGSHKQSSNATPHRKKPRKGGTSSAPVPPANQSSQER